ncbi:transposable element Tcb1 transposase [Trichonephila clavipes]|nr:transposable element Tcb1 transposase [Trichonephila clavipes]
MVWAGIMINGRTRLHVVANGTMTGQRYIDEVLLPHVRLFRGAVGDKFVFMDDNATCHRTLAVQDCLDSEVAGRNYPPTNKNTLIRALTEEWDKLPQQLLDNVVQRSFAMREKDGNRLAPDQNYMVDALKLPNQAPRGSSESLQKCVAGSCPDRTQLLFCWPIVTVSGESLAC